MKKFLLRASRALGLSGTEINFLLVGDAAIRRLNRRYLRHNRPTDVIAFSMGEKGILGDVAVSVDTALRQAREQGHSLERELKILALHGLLHLVGYRDKRKKDRQRMWRKTDRLLRECGG